jgi:hypothetical protein
MKTYWIIDYKSIGFTIGGGRRLYMDSITYECTDVIHFTIGILFWTYVINIDI